MHRRRLMQAGLGLSAGLFAGPLSRPASAAPASDLWPRWTAHDPASVRTVDHAAWSGFLSRHLVAGGDGVNRLRYSAAAGDRATLDGYLAMLQAVPVGGLARPEQFAYWTNLYNALTVAVVLDHYPVASIRDIDISPGLFANGPWGAEMATVDGTALTLDDIEHRILRPIWGDARVHYAVNCAAIGCPNLQRTAFTAAALERMLEAGARAYVNDPRGARVEDGRLTASSIYDWFQEDFGGTETGVIGHLRRYADAGLESDLAGIVDIDDFAYDWSLNDA